MVPNEGHLCKHSIPAASLWTADGRHKPGPSKHEWRRASMGAGVISSGLEGNSGCLFVDIAEKGVVVCQLYLSEVP